MVALASSPSRRLDPERERLLLFVGVLRARLWGKRALERALRTVAAVAGLLLIARWFASLGAFGAADALLLLAGMTAVGGVIAAVRSRPSPADAARAADRSLKLQERLGTALELVEGAHRGELAELQIADTGALLANRRPAEAVGPLVSRRDLAVAVAAVLVALVTWVTLPDLSALVRAPFGGGAGPEPAAAPVTSDLRENNVNDILGSIEETRRRAQERQIDPAEAQRQLNEAAARLNARIEASTRQQQNLQALADQLRQTTTAQDVAGAIDRGEYSLAGDLLNQLARESDQLSPQARRELAQALERAAQQTQQNPALRDALRRAAQALNRGDYQEIDRAMRNLSDQVGMAGRDVVSQSELGRAQSRLDQARRELGLNDSQAGGDRGGMEAQGGQLSASGQQSGDSSARGSQPGTMPGQNRPGSGGQEALPGQRAPQQQGVGNQRSGELPQFEGRSDDRLGVSGRLLQLESPDAGGELRPSDGEGEQRGSILTTVRPAAGVGVAQPTEPVVSPADTTLVSPERRVSVRSYFTSVGR
ncbi:MAG: hypothetical protein RMM58_09350 [Chloroflexota bacterium]|nr:hypothetical protein [Dehalococcoidia bacterium]MDW8254072.1 hypothetical protein [Chloroflexota bacterium]